MSLHPTANSILHDAYDPPSLDLDRRVSVTRDRLISENAFDLSADGNRLLTVETNDEGEHRSWTLQHTQSGSRVGYRDLPSEIASTQIQFVHFVGSEGDMLVSSPQQFFSHQRKNRRDHCTAIRPQRFSRRASRAHRRCDFWCGPRAVVCTEEIRVFARFLITILGSMSTFRQPRSAPMENALRPRRTRNYASTSWMSTTVLSTLSPPRRTVRLSGQRL